MQEDKQKPNFDFIMDQPGPVLEKPKRSKKPFVIFGIAMVFLCVLTVIGLVLSKKTQVKSELSPQQQAVVQVTDKYFYNASLAKAEEAYELLSPTAQERVKKSDFILYVGGVVYNTIDFAKCSRGDAPVITDKTATVNYNCPTKDGQATMKFAIKLSQFGEGYKIDSYDMNTGSA